MSKTKRIRDMYIKNIPIDVLCKTLGISRGTFYYHKAKDLEKGISWDNRKMIKDTNIKDLEDDEKEFIGLLTFEFKKALEEIRKIKSPESKLESLSKYVLTYYKLKVPKKDDCKVKFVQVATKVIYELANLAQKQKNKKVIEFLSNNEEIIIEAIITNKKL